jgi:hypothetical protein
MGIAMPSSLKHEHGELLAELDAATKAAGSTGAAAQEVARLLRPHFKREEEFALPPLGLLESLAHGAMPEDADAAVALASRFTEEISAMLDEHKAISEALKRMFDTAEQEQRQDCARFARKLMLHARMEEEIYYPATIVIGDYLTLKKGRR